MTEKKYLSAKDLMDIIPNLKYGRALAYIKEAQQEMKEKGYFIPETKTKIALTKILKKKFGF